MASKSLDDLTPDMKRMAQRHIQLCKEQGYDLLIYCTLRPNSEQNDLYAQGRTAPGKIVTNARAGESAHNPDDNGKAHAYDCCPLDGGKAIWDSNHPAWRVVGSCGEAAGLVWSGRWAGKLKETAHFEDPLFKSQARR